MIKEHPILFSTEMVKAILKERKTQTRRVVKPVGRDAGFALTASVGDSDWWPYRSDDGESMFVTVRGQESHIPMECPYGQVGDRLWVRETWYHDSWMGEMPVIYKADAEIHSWRPAIFMPRWASRITLEITGVKVERVQEISNVDIQAEGTQGLHPQGGLFPNQWHEQYKNLWDKINGKKYPWASNPWVWVITFKRVI